MEDENTLLVLAPGVEFIAADDVSEKEKHGISIEEDDVVITYAGTRQGSKLISKEFSLLLKQFEQPQSLAAAIFNYSSSNNKNPEEVAEEVFNLLLSMQYSGFLVSNTNGIDLKKDRLQPGALFRGYTVLKKVYGYEDTQVYQIKDALEKKYALKLLTAHTNQHVVNMFHNEVNMLNRLNGKINPTLKEQGEEDDIPFLITAWCDGEPCTAAAAHYKNINSRDNALKLMDIAIAVAQAFHQLHRQGIIHGDIQAPNILISKKNEVKIIDYGYAAWAANENKIIRGGTGFLFEPEYAAAFLKGKKAPALTEPAEQYSLAVLLYQIITGQGYLDFKFETKALYEQILNEAPISLKKFDLHYPTELDAVFAKALSKKPEDRFASVNALAEALQDVRNKIRNSSNFFIGSDENKEENFTSFLINKFGWESAFIEKGLSKEPTCSVNYGAAGIAYMYYRMACTRQDADLINLADTWANLASLYEKDFDKSFYSVKLGVTQKKIGRNSLYHSPAGVYLVQALISYAKNDFHTLAKSITGFVMAAQKESTQLDVTLGRCGLLLGCSLLCRELKTSGYNLDIIKKLGASLLEEIWTGADKEPAMNVANNINYFGIAHGWSGLLYATLHWCTNTGTALPQNFNHRIDELMACAVKKDHLIYWPLSQANKNSWPGWCNGNAGHIFLLVLLYKHFNDAKFLNLAEALSNGIINLPHYNNNLCCGLSGMAYSMMALYKITGDKKYLEAVQKTKQSIIKNIASPMDDNNSLYKGEVGLGLLFCESAIPDLARMPLFE